MHAEIAIAAAQAGKMILCEKPLAMNGPEGLKMVEAVEKAKGANMVWYNNRRLAPTPHPRLPVTSRSRDTNFPITHTSFPPHPHSPTPPPHHHTPPSTL